MNVVTKKKVIDCFDNLLLKIRQDKKRNEIEARAYVGIKYIFNEHKKLFLKMEKKNKWFEKIYVDVSKKNYVRKYSEVELEFVSKLTKVWFDETELDKGIIRNELLDTYENSYNYSGKEVFTSLHIEESFKLRDPEVLKMLQSRAQMLSPQILEANWFVLKEKITRAFYDEGKHPTQIAREIGNMIEETYKNRAKTIARTETNWVVSKASEEVYKRMRVPMKKWITIGVGACIYCSPLNGQIVKQEETFSNGWNSPADSHPNCRCVLAPHVGEEYIPREIWTGEEEWMPYADEEYVNVWNSDSVYKKTVYHGTSTSSANNIIMNGFIDASEKGTVGGRVFGNGIYLTDDKKWADFFASQQKGKVLETKVKIKNPYKMDFTKGTDLENWKSKVQEMVKEFPEETKAEAIKKWMMKRDYDSIQIQQSQLETVVFDPKNIMVIKK